MGRCVSGQFSASQVLIGDVIFEWPEFLLKFRPKRTQQVLKIPKYTEKKTEINVCIFIRYTCAQVLQLYQGGCLKIGGGARRLAAHCSKISKSGSGNLILYMVNLKFALPKFDFQNRSNLTK